MIMSEVLVGLSQRQKSIHPKFLYDKRGSEIFEEICELEEYYPTRAELEILRDHGEEMAQLIGERALVIEPGSGSAQKVRYLLGQLANPSGYVPIEICPEILERSVEELRELHPGLAILPLLADFTTELEIKEVPAEVKKRVVFFPGSTIGNFSPEEAQDFLRRYLRLCGPEGGLLIGADRKKDPDRLLRAYDDPSGVTAAFNLNLLERLNREAEASFDPENFYHRAIYNEEQGRVEMHLVSKVSQMVQVHQSLFRFNEGESIHTESSYKYSVEEFIELCAKVRLRLKQYWTDREGLFCVYYFEKG